MNAARIVIDQVGVCYRARIVKVVPSRSALCISPEKFLEGKQLDLWVADKLFGKREDALHCAEAIMDVRFAAYSKKQ